MHFFLLAIRIFHMILLTNRMSGKLLFSQARFWICNLQFATFHWDRDMERVSESLFTPFFASARQIGPQDREPDFSGSLSGAYTHLMQ